MQEIKAIIIEITTWQFSTLNCTFILQGAYSIDKYDSPRCISFSGRVILRITSNQVRRNGNQYLSQQNPLQLIRPAAKWSFTDPVDTKLQN